MNCQYCHSRFTRKSSLTKHLKSAKYCLDLQNKIIGKYCCDKCQQKFTSEDVLIYHRQNCGIVEILQNQLDNLSTKLANKPTTINNLAVFDPEIIKNYLPQLTSKYVGPSGDGFAQFFKDTKMLENKAIITDLSRLVFKFYLPSGNLNGQKIIDKGGNKISQILFTGIRDKSEQLIQDKIDYYKTRMEDDFQDEVTKLASEDIYGDMIRDMEKIRYQIGQICDGQIRPISLRNKFIKYISKIVQNKDDIKIIVDVNADGISNIQLTH